jgi:D-amino-acid oxidase
VARDPHAVVVGAGVTGLTTALALVADGWRVDVITAEDPRATTSAVAAAFWYPYLVGGDRVAAWGRTSAAQFAQLAGVPGTGVASRTVRERFRTAEVDPAWRLELPDAAHDADDLGPDHRDGWRFTSWVAAMPTYLGWLLAQLATADVEVGVTLLDDLDDAWRPGVDLVVDCAGVGARALADDATVVPVAGQALLVDTDDLQVPVHDVWLDAEHPGGPTYVVPRGDGTVLLGGTSVAGQADRSPSTDVTADVLSRCRALVPALADVEPFAAGVGLRPSRPEVRLELAPGRDSLVLHHYGHGGAGVTLSWGAAAEAAALARSIRG